MTTAYNFPFTSRYSAVEIASFHLPDGRVVPHLRRRFLPRPDSFVLLQEHVVGESDRMDRVADFYLGDPEAFWRIADANTLMNPAALADTPGRRLRITLPLGVPGVPNA